MAGSEAERMPSFVDSSRTTVAPIRFASQYFRFVLQLVDQLFHRGHLLAGLAAGRGGEADVLDQRRRLDAEAVGGDLADLLLLGGHDPLERGVALALLPLGVGGGQGLVADRLL